MLCLASAAWAVHGPHVECTAPDLAWRMFRNAHVHPEQNIRLWEDAQGALTGFAWLYRNGDVDLLVHPRAHATRIVPEVLAWAHERQRAPGALDAGKELRLWALEGNASLSAALRASGAVRAGGCYLHLLRALEDLPPLSVPQGYSVRAVRGPAEAAARAAVHRRAFGTERMTEQVYLRLTQAPLYRAELDLVVETDAGELAALALCWLDARAALGELEPVATAPGHRRRGLARALILSGLHRMREAGAQRALVYAAADAPAAVALYQSLGFRTVDRNLGYTVPAPSALGT